MNRLLFILADFLSRPPGFYAMVIAMVACTLLVPFGLTNTVTYALSAAAIIITGIVLIQGYRDTAAIHAKLDEIVIALRQTRNDVVGLEHADTQEIKSKPARPRRHRRTRRMRPVPQRAGGVGVAEAPAEGGGMGTAATQR
ncbi:MAG: hypothetical protein E5X21_09915 [Mesorhizobium sp.]|nr:MAG: hypothetical protein E5X21_09915 [Mesorhizobium sp.]